MIPPAAPHAKPHRRVSDSFAAQLGASPWTLIVALVGFAVAWGVNQATLRELQSRTGALESAAAQNIPAIRADVQAIRQDLDALLRFRCIDSSVEQQRLAGIRCADGLQGRAGGSTP
jgi:hypothetical protein